MAEKNINIRRRLSLASLALAWFTVFAVPAVLLQVSLNYLFEITLQANRQAAVATLSGEMNSFRRDLKAEAFVERKLIQFFAGHSDFRHGASATAEILSRSTGLKLAAVVTHAEDFAEVDAVVATHVQKQLPFLPRNLMRRYLVAINQSQKTFDRRLRKDADIFLRRQFGLISEIPLEPGRICRAVSAKLEGPAFFFYQPIWQASGNQRKIVGGCLVVLRGCDLDQRQILSDVVQLQARGVRRGFSRLKVALDGDRPQTRKIITDYLADADGQHMLSTFPDTVIVDLIQAGGLVPKNLERVELPAGRPCLITLHTGSGGCEAACRRFVIHKEFPCVITKSCSWSIRTRVSRFPP